jgi:CRISPR type III-B/RAMP module RAMP protein Cmr4
LPEWLKAKCFARRKLSTATGVIHLEKRLVILPENAFRDFVQLSTEVIARVRIDDTKKTVERGALWTEEHLPSETLLYATLFASKPRVKVRTRRSTCRMRQLS